MEVHAHSHTPRKKWTHYFWEFFMLFFAVFLGYLAELKLEHNVEQNREQKLMLSLLRDLSVDKSQLAIFKPKRELKIRQCDSLINQLSNTPSEQETNTYYWGRMATRRNHFYPQDIALQQLKNSGGFRVIHDQDVLDAVNAYESLLKDNKENIELEEKELGQYSEMAGKIFNVSVFQEMAKTDSMISRPPGDPLLFSYDKQLINELCIKLHYWKRTSMTTIDIFNRIDKKADSLINLITHEYGIKSWNKQH